MKRQTPKEFAPRPTGHVDAKLYEKAIADAEYYQASCRDAAEELRNLRGSLNYANTCHTEAVARLRKELREAYAAHGASITSAARVQQQLRKERALFVFTLTAAIAIEAVLHFL